jgi:hypothetical protein
MMNKFLIIVFIAIIISPIFAQEGNFDLADDSQDYDYSYEEDIVYLILNEINLYSYEIIDTGIFDDGITYTVFKINENVIITISVDENGVLYIIGNVETHGAMREILDYLTGIYTDPIPYLDGDGYTAFFLDTENLYIKEDFPDYIGTFTLYGNYLFVEEVITQEKIIIQRQWCTPDFYEINTTEFGDNWGFFAAWDTVEYVVMVEPETVEPDLVIVQPQETLPAQYTVRQWATASTKGDCFSSIAAMPFIYGDPFKWEILFEANRSKLPIHPGTVLDIPSLKGEVRSGMWVSDE